MSNLPADELLTDAQSTEVWNNLPFETRKALAVHWNHSQIRHLEVEKIGLKRMFDRRIREINQHISNIRESIRRG